MLMKKLLAIAFIAVINMNLFAEDLSENREASKTLGYLIGKKTSSREFYFDVEAFLEGLQNSKSDLDASLEDDYLHLLNILQNFISIEKKNTNLKIADHFFNKNKNNSNVVEVVPGKLQYKIIHKGNGEKTTEQNNPLINYKATTLDDKLLYKTTEPQIISLFDIDSGFSKGILGMKEGEIRNIYVHPDYYCLSQKNNNETRPLKFEVELIKRHQNYEIDKSLTSSHEYFR